MSQFSKILALFLILLSSHSLAAQKDFSKKNKARVSFEVGLEAGIQRLASQYTYTPASEVLISDIRFNVQDRLLFKLYFGAVFNEKHAVGIALQECPLRAGYVIDYTPDILVSYSFSQSGLYSGIYYRYDFNIQKNFMGFIGPHLGMVLFNSRDEFPSDDGNWVHPFTDENGNSKNLVVNYRGDLLSNRPLNFGFNTGIAYEIGKVKLTLGYGLNYSPSKVREVDMNYYIGGEDVKNAVSKTNILNHSIGIGCVFTFF